MVGFCKVATLCLLAGNKRIDKQLRGLNRRYKVCKGIMWIVCSGLTPAFRGLDGCRVTVQMETAIARALPGSRLAGLVVETSSTEMKAGSLEGLCRDCFVGGFPLPPLLVSNEWKVVLYRY